MRALGRLEEGQERQRADFDAEKHATHDHRVTMYNKLDKVEETIGIVGQVAAQAREEAKAIKKVVEEDVKPATDDFKRMRSFGKWTITAVAFGATALGITLATVSEGVVNTVRSWLHIQ